MRGQQKLRNAYELLKMLVNARATAICRVAGPVSGVSRQGSHHMSSACDASGCGIMQR